jgi:DNA helicase-2/ATP-dependent DNA helicase PcrA
MGVYLVDPADLGAYRTAYAPQELRWSKSTVVDCETVLNFGQVKGASFDRVLVHATAPMRLFTPGVGAGRVLRR